VPRTRLITVSGVAGSGKSTAIDDIVRHLAASGTSVEKWRFRTLPCFKYLQPRFRSSGSSRGTKRWVNFRRKPLTARATVTYVLRTLAFRLYRWMDGGDGVRVTNRYFFDNFAHYTVATRRERLYRALLRRATPRPDLALVMTASPEVLSARRPEYSEEYLRQLSEAYRDLRDWSDVVIEVPTDTAKPAADVISALIRERLPRA
jgi:thymidylate kinase